MRNNLAGSISLFSNNEMEIIPKEIKKKQSRATLPKILVNISHELLIQETLFLPLNEIRDNPLNNVVKFSPKEQLKEQNVNDDIEANEIEEIINNIEETINDVEVDKITKNIGLNKFFQDAHRYKILTREEEYQYFTFYNNTQDLEIRNIIICSNIKLVIAVAKRISKMNTKLMLEDMINEGIIGLIKAIDKFDPDRNFKFSTYAFPWIRQAINRSIANTGDMIRVPVHFTDNMAKIKKFENEYMMKNNVEEVSDEIVSANLKISINKIKKYRKASQSVGSLDIELDENGNTGLNIVADKESINPEDTTINSILREDLIEAINLLSDREAFIIKNRYNIDISTEPLTTKQLAQKLGLTKERIRQIEMSALEKLKHPLKSKKYRGFYS